MQRQRRCLWSQLGSNLSETEADKRQTKRQRQRQTKRQRAFYKAESGVRIKYNNKLLKPKNFKQLSGFTSTDSTFSDFTSTDSTFSDYTSTDFTFSDPTAQGALVSIIIRFSDQGYSSVTARISDPDQLDSACYKIRFRSRMTTGSVNMTQEQTEQQSSEVTRTRIWI